MFKNPSFIFDIICTVVWLLLAVRYARKGFLAAVVQLTGNLVSLFGARQFSGWAAGQVFEQFFANSFRDQIAASISAEGAVSLSGIAAKYAGFLPESFRASIVEACERSISAVLNDNAVVLADVIVQKVLAPLLTPVISLVLFFVAADARQSAGHGAGAGEQAPGHRGRQPRAWLGRRRTGQPRGHLSGALRGLGTHRHHRRQSHRSQRYGDERQPLL